MNRSADLGVKPIPGGLPCPHCHEPMQRYEHSPEWHALPGRGRYTYWDCCPPCRHFQNYRQAYVPATATVADATLPTTD